MKRSDENMHLRRSQLLDTETCQPLSHINALLNWLALHKSSNEATSESITSTIGITDSLLVDSMHWVGLGALALSGDNSWQSSLCDDSNSLLLGVDLGQVGQVLGNLSDVLGLKAVALSVCQGLSFIANDNIPVWGTLVQWLLEELADKWCGQGDNEGLVVLCGLLSHGHDGLRADSEVITANIDGLSVLDQAPDLWFLQVLNLVVVGSSEVGAHASVVTSDNDTATASWVLSINTVLDTKSSLLVGIFQGRSVLVVAHAADVDNGVFWEHVLRATSSVLCRTASNKLCVEVVEEVFVEAKMLLFGQNSIVLLQSILVQKSLVASGLDVWMR